MKTPDFSDLDAALKNMPKPNKLKPDQDIYTSPTTIGVMLLFVPPGLNISCEVCEKPAFAGLENIRGENTGCVDNAWCHSHLLVILIAFRAKMQYKLDHNLIDPKNYPEI